jgi:osmotically-inducible protein OsmY
MDPRVDRSSVSVSVEDGVATITGTVGNLPAKRKAEAEALDTLGIWRVKNHLRVRTAVRGDEEIAKDIRAALRRSNYVDRYEIDVSVYDGKAHLNGEVDTLSMKQQAEEVASEVRGVVDIQNDLRVEYQLAEKSDRAIEEDIESQLFWSPFVDSDDITVEVQGGTATLTGTVEDWGELQAAEENAHQGGAASVISKLELEHAE